MSPRPIPSPAVSSFWQAPPPPDRARTNSYDPTRLLPRDARDLWAIDRRRRPRTRTSGPWAPKPGAGLHPDALWGILTVATRRWGGRLAHLPVVVCSVSDAGCVLRLVPPTEKCPPVVEALARLCSTSLLDAVSLLASAPRVFEDVRRRTEEVGDGTVEGALSVHAPGREATLEIACVPLCDPREGVLGVRFVSAPDRAVLPVDHPVLPLATPVGGNAVPAPAVEPHR